MFICVCIMLKRKNISEFFLILGYLYQLYRRKRIQVIEIYLMHKNSADVL